MLYIMKLIGVLLFITTEKFSYSFLMIPPPPLLPYYLSSPSCTTTKTRKIITTAKHITHSSSLLFVAQEDYETLAKEEDPSSKFADDYDGILTEHKPSQSSSVESDKETNNSTLTATTASSSSSSSKTYLTNAVVRLSYDGYRFTGWSAANTAETMTTNNNNQQQQKHQQQSHNKGLTRPNKRNRRRGAIGELKRGHIRSVEGVLRENLAKLYGNVDPARVVVEGCSRTDRGVHARGMVAQIYCLKEGMLEQISLSTTTAKEQQQQNTNQTTFMTTSKTSTTIYCSIPGKRRPHPISATDNSYFEPIPMDGNLSRLAFALNRMKPSDLQVTGIAPTPSTLPLSIRHNHGDDERQVIDDQLPFHPSLSTSSKTYEYRVSIGVIHDPTLQHIVWHVPTSSSSSSFDLEKIQKGCQILEGTHDFIAFQGSPRGSADKQKRIKQQQTNPNTASRCTLTSIRILEEQPPIMSDDYFCGVDPPIKHYKFTITGDRFLYKMVRFLVGSLVAVGTGKLGLEDLKNALETGNWNYNISRSEEDEETGSVCGREDERNNSCDGQKIISRRKEFHCAPAHGLILQSADYGNIQFDWKPLRDSSKTR